MLVPKLQAVDQAPLALNVYKRCLNHLGLGDIDLNIDTHWHPCTLIKTSIKEIVL